MITRVEHGMRSDKTTMPS